MQLQEKHSGILLNYISCSLAKMLKQRNEYDKKMKIPCELF